MDLGLQTQAVNDECKPIVLVMFSKDANHFVVFIFQAQIQINQSGALVSYLSSLPVLCLGMKIEFILLVF